MSKNLKPGQPSRDYVVGYGRPPVESRFQPGRSGNPRGRPKGGKSIGRALMEALEQRVTVQIGGRPRKMRMQDVIIQGLVQGAARRDARALKQLFALMDRDPEVHEQEKETFKFTLKINHPRDNDDDESAE